MKDEIMQAYLNDPGLKSQMVASMREHREADRLVKGSYGEDRQGTPDFWACAVGCALESVSRLGGKTIPADDHASFEPELGIPEWLAHLIDKIFENLPEEAAQVWPVRFLEAVPVGADLETVKKPFLLWLMERNRGLVEGLDISDDLKRQVLAAIDGVVVAISDGDVARAAAADAARAAARDAARDAAVAAVGVDDAAAARDAAVAAVAARDAAVVAAADHVAYAARDAAAAVAARDAAADAADDADADADAGVAYAAAYVSIADELVDLVAATTASETVSGGGA